MRYDGVTKERPFTDVNEMDEALINGWNSVVRPQDTIYHLGDVCLNRSALPTLDRLNGKKILIPGNHDVFKFDDYLMYFDDIRGSFSLAGFMLSHIPIHPDSIGRWKGNIHGHLHNNSVRLPDGSVDPRYMCVSVEQTFYKPISLDDAIQLFYLRGGC